MKNPLPVPTACRYDGGPVEIVGNAEIYGREYGKWPWAFLCRTCRAYVGMHPFTGIPLGTLADAPTREARKHAKAALNPLWESGAIASRAYAWLAGRATRHQKRRGMPHRLVRRDDVQPIDPWLIYGLNWVIVGGESGHAARPMRPDWARSLRDQCAAAGVPFLFKQWGEWRPHDPEDTNHPLVADPQHCQYLTTTDNRSRPAHVYGQQREASRARELWMQRVGKRAGGRPTDRRADHQHDQRG